MKNLRIELSNVLLQDDNPIGYFSSTEKAFEALYKVNDGTKLQISLLWIGLAEEDPDFFITFDDLIQAKESYMKGFMGQEWSHCKIK